MLPGIMALPSIKIFLVVYLMIALGSLLWQMHVGEYLEQCEFNADACSNALQDYGVTALIWPSQMFVVRTI